MRGKPLGNLTKPDRARLIAMVRDGKPYREIMATSFRWTAGVMALPNAKLVRGIFRKEGRRDYSAEVVGAVGNGSALAEDEIERAEAMLRNGCGLAGLLAEKWGRRDGSRRHLGTQTARQMVQRFEDLGRLRKELRDKREKIEHPDPFVRVYMQLLHKSEWPRREHFDDAA